ncbi:hypothetical protein JQ621_19270 [Bradyrhizobium manausense]|uniref:hypothetical protein n=1 Tax=Bradyrhizobium manausense TaxID=989370 RepID=UPI001BA69461|nr:hypothetical protein [Bradyrhizobium manausense]MBR1089608.1 hypothetical protein [Bradyrhizobium manausense]
MGLRIKAALFGIVQWTAEATIGLIPLGLYLIVNKYSSLPTLGLCTQATYNVYLKLYNGCSPLGESASAEVCILSIVISGLAILSVVPFGRKQREFTLWTGILVLFALIALILGALFYALFTAHLDKEADTITYGVLVMALLSSLCLSIEGAILEA